MTSAGDDTVRSCQGRNFDVHIGGDTIWRNAPAPTIQADRSY